MKKILFITTANLSTNPRLYKEIKLAERSGYHTSFMAFRQGGWSDEKDKVLLEEIKGDNHYLSALRKPFLPWVISSILNNICIRIWPYFKKNLLITALAHNKRSFLLHRYLKKHRGKYDLIIGHNLGTLYPIYCYAKKHNIPFAFDVEDYHPGEASANIVKGEVERRKFLISSLLPKSAYYSYASPLIGEHTDRLIDPSLFSKSLLINNIFSTSEFSKPFLVEGKLKLVWFSQTISFGRGLELIIPVLSLFRKKISFNLIGNLHDGFFDKWIKPNEDFVTVCKPLVLGDLLKVLSGFDVGLALEPGKDGNNLIALSNKIWAYLQSGLYILATDTPAQKIFMSEFSSHGIVTGQDPESFKAAIEELLEKKREIRDAAQYRYRKTKDIAWETEGRKLQNTWREVLSPGDINPANLRRAGR